LFCSLFNCKLFNLILIIYQIAIKSIMIMLNIFNELRFIIFWNIFISEKEREKQREKSEYLSVVKVRICTAESYAQNRVVEIWIRSDRSQQFVRFSFSSRKFAFDFSADSEEVFRRILSLNTSNCQLDRVELKQFFASTQLNNTSILCYYYINVINYYIIIKCNL